MIDIEDELFSVPLARGGTRRLLGRFWSVLTSAGGSAASRGAASSSCVAARGVVCVRADVPHAAAERGVSPAAAAPLRGPPGRRGAAGLPRAAPATPQDGAPRHLLPAPPRHRRRAPCPARHSTRYSQDSRDSFSLKGH